MAEAKAEARVSPVDEFAVVVQAQGQLAAARQALLNAEANPSNAA